jgi:2,4-didehydro-3-deoxy-L-rhamnonate hydrolase
VEIPASVAGSKTWREMAAHGTYFSSSKLSLRGTLSSRCESKTLKLIRFGEAGRERPGVLLDDGSRLDVSDFVPDCDEAFFARGGMESLRDWLNSPFSSAPRVPSTIRLGSPISRPSKIICIGLNYRDHAAETGAALPKEPVIFFKATTSLVGPNDALVIPRNATKVDWEVELAFVIGKTALYVPRDEALDDVAGYVLHTDYSERSFQLERGGQWVKGKSCRYFRALGSISCLSGRPS